MVDGSRALCNDNRHDAISGKFSSRVVLNNTRREIQEPSKWYKLDILRFDIQDFSDRS
jgi:hypothetical protein